MNSHPSLWPLADRRRSRPYIDGAAARAAVDRYNGKATIAFDDGRAALVSPAEAKKLIWKP